MKYAIRTLSLQKSKDKVMLLKLMDNGFTL